MRFGWNARDSFKRTLWTAYVAASLFLLSYVVIYWFEPFTPFWNDFFSNFYTVVAAAGAALVSMMIWRLYDKTDAPRRVWGPFMTGLWLWLAAELSWGFINLIQGEVPVGLPDVFWVTSYAFLGLAIGSQYMLLFNPTQRKLMSRITILAVLMAVFTWLTYRLIISTAGTSDRWDAFVNAFYPVADLMLAIIALKVVRNLSGGAFARPWLGLLVFAFADLIYAWLQISGMYSWSVDQGNLLTTVADVSYLAAYLVMGTGLLYQWLFLKYGMRPQ